MLTHFTEPLTLIDSAVVTPRPSVEAALRSDADRLQTISNRATAFGLFHEAILSAHRLDPSVLSARRSPSTLGYRAVAESEASLSALAEAVAAPLAARISHPARVGLVCQSTVDEAVSQSLACRMAGLLGAECCVFGLGAGQSAAMHAVEMAVALLQDADAPGAALLVGAERWLAPYPRTIDGFAVRGDGAAGATLTNDPMASGWRVTDLIVEPAPPIIEAAAYADEPLAAAWRKGNAARGALITHAAATIRRLLDALEQRPADIAFVAAPALEPALVEAVADALDWGDRTLDTDAVARGDLAAAELFRLMHSLRDQPAEPGDRALLWTLDAGGIAGALALRYDAPGAGSRKERP